MELRVRFNIYHLIYFKVHFINFKIFGKRLKFESNLKIYISIALLLSLNQMQSHFRNLRNYTHKTRHRFQRFSMYKNYLIALRCKFS